MRALMDGSIHHAVLNVCTGQATTINTLAALLAKQLGRRAQMTPAPARAGDIRLSCGDPAKAKEMLGMSAMIGLQEGLATLEK